MLLRAVVTAGIGALVLTVPAPAVAAERLYGITEGGQLVRFQSDSPGAIRSTLRISGLVEDNERLIGIDVRPANGALYGVSDASRLYRLNPANAAASPVGPGPFSPSLRDQTIGFDFNPAVDRIRIASRTGQNLRVNPDTLEVTVDRDLSYAGNGFGSPAVRDPGVVAAAYGATGTLYDIDSLTSTLTRQDPPNAGTLVGLGGLGLDIQNQAGFDIARDGRAWASLRTAADSATSLYRLSLVNGRATPATRRATIQTFRGGQPDPLVALAAGGTVADDKRRPRLVVRASKRVNRRDLLLRRNVTVAVRTSEPARLTLQLLSGRRVVGSAGRDRLGVGGRSVLRAKATNKGLRILRRGGGALRYRVIALDEAGNRTVTRPRAR